MKQINTETGGRKSSRSWAGCLASAVALFLLTGSAAKADVVVKFDLSGNLNTYGAPATFTGTMKLDISDDFMGYEAQSISISVNNNGQKSVFSMNPSVGLASGTGTIRASIGVNGDDMLTLLFTPPPALPQPGNPQPGDWTSFDTGAGKIFFGYFFGGVTDTLLGAQGVITLAPGQTIPYPPDPLSLSVPEPSTWAMMLLGLAGLGLAGKGRRAWARVGGKA